MEKFDFTRIDADEIFSSIQRHLYNEESLSESPDTYYIEDVLCGLYDEERWLSVNAKVEAYIYDPEYRKIHVSYVRLIVVNDQNEEVLSWEGDWCDAKKEQEQQLQLQKGEAA